MTLLGSRAPSRIVRASEGESVQIDGLGVRFLVGGADSGGGFSLVEHPIAPRSMAAGLHTHAGEDEYSYVLEGEIGVQLGDDVMVARAGDLAFKPRGIPHAFWNPTDTPARVLEVISPGGFEEMFHEVAEAWGQPEPDLDRVDEIMRRYGLDFDMGSESWIPVREGFATADGGIAVPRTSFGPAPAGSILRPDEGERVQMQGLGVRILVSGERSGGGFSLVEHPLAPRSLGAPLHSHRHEDQYAFVVEGEVGIQIGDDVLHARAGDLVVKPRGVPHAFWNASERPARLLELTSPAGFERYFAEAAALMPPSRERPDLDALAALSERFGLEADLSSVVSISRREGLPLTTAT